jgi:secreted trypsin-like serine protease
LKQGRRPTDALFLAGYPRELNFEMYSQGDSGGPLLVAEEDGLYSMVGVSSFSAPPACGNPDFPDVYMRTSAFASWVALVLAIPPPPQDLPSPFGPFGP